MFLLERRRASERNRRAAAVGEPGEVEEEVAAERRAAVGDGQAEAAEAAEVPDETECTGSVVEICTGQEDYTAV